MTLHHHRRPPAGTNRHCPGADLNPGGQSLDDGGCPWPGWSTV